MGKEEMEQVSIFDIFPEETHLFKTNKPIRLIELFAGVGAQAMALRNIGADFEHYKISEWDVNSVKSYRAIHMGYENVEPWGSRDENAEILYNLGASQDGKSPLSLEQIKNKGNKWICQTLDDYRVTHNIGSITQIKGKDLGVKDTDKYTYLLTYLLFPLSRLKCSRTRQGHDQRVRDSIRTPVGSRESWEKDGKKYLIRIRKLTPKECWRLMGFTDEDFQKAAEVNSNSMLYKQAGNSIVPQVLSAIFENLIGETS